MAALSPFWQTTPHQRPVARRTQGAPKEVAKTTRRVPVTLSAAHPPDPAGLVENTPPHPQRIVRPVPFLQVGFLDVQSTVTGRGKSEEPAASLHTVHPAPPAPIRTPIIRSAHRTYASTSHTTRWGTAQRSHSHCGDHTWRPRETQRESQSSAKLRTGSKLRMHHSSTRADRPARLVRSDGRLVPLRRRPHACAPSRNAPSRAPWHARNAPSSPPARGRTPPPAA